MTRTETQQTAPGRHRGETRSGTGPSQVPAERVQPGTTAALEVMLRDLPSDDEQLLGAHFLEDPDYVPSASGSDVNTSVCSSDNDARGTPPAGPADADGDNADLARTRAQLAEVVSEWGIHSPGGTRFKGTIEDLWQAAGGLTFEEAVHQPRPRSPDTSSSDEDARGTPPTRPQLLKNLKAAKRRLRVAGSTPSGLPCWIGYHGRTRPDGIIIEGLQWERRLRRHSQACLVIHLLEFTFTSENYWAESRHRKISEQYAELTDFRYFFR